MKVEVYTNNLQIVPSLLGKSPLMIAIHVSKIQSHSSKRFSSKVYIAPNFS